jgi:hypothetical protein
MPIFDSLAIPNIAAKTMGRQISLRIDRETLVEENKT